MTPQQIEALKLALEALKEAQTNDDGMEKWDRNKKAITALEEALAQPEQEPVADDIASILACRDMLDAQPVPEVDRVIWPERTEQVPVQFKCTVVDDAHPNGIPLEQWTPPPQRKPLTDDALTDLWFKQSLDWIEFARAIEAAHGIKENT